MTNSRFWNSVEKLEAQLLGGQIGPKEFRRKMRRKGFDFEVIAERQKAVQEEWDAIYLAPLWVSADRQHITQE